MNLNELVTLTYWNGLARSYLAELIMVLTAALIALTDRYVRRMLAKATASLNPVSRFLVFLLACSVGYGLLALGLARVLRHGLTAAEGAYMAPAVLGLLLITAIEAQRQRQA